jgi:hypothetical protein
MKTLVTWAYILPPKDKWLESLSCENIERNVQENGNYLLSTAKYAIGYSCVISCF